MATIICWHEHSGETCNGETLVQDEPPCAPIAITGGPFVDGPDAAGDTTITFWYRKPEERK